MGQIANSKMAHFIKYTTKLRRYPEQCRTKADACLILDDGSRHDVHRVILAANAKFFKSMFLFDYGRKEFNLKEVNKNVITTVLDYFYTKEINLTLINLENIVKFANYIDCQEILKLCSEFLLKKVTFNLH